MRIRRLRNPYGHGPILERNTYRQQPGILMLLVKFLLVGELRITFCVLAILLFIVVWLSYPCYLSDKCYENQGIVREFLIDAHGTILDIAVVDIVVLWLNQRLKRRNDSIEYQEEIDSLRGWRDSEAGIRILRNLRRLNRNGVTSIFLTRAIFD